MIIAAGGLDKKILDPVSHPPKQWFLDATDVFGAAGFQTSLGHFEMSKNNFCFALDHKVRVYIRLSYKGDQTKAVMS